MGGWQFFCIKTRYCSGNRFKGSCIYQQFTMHFSYFMIRTLFSHSKIIQSTPRLPLFRQNEDIEEFVSDFFLNKHRWRDIISNHSMLSRWSKREELCHWEREGRYSKIPLLCKGEWGVGSDHPCWVVSQEPWQIPYIFFYQTVLYWLWWSGSCSFDRLQLQMPQFVSQRQLTIHPSIELHN